MSIYLIYILFIISILFLLLMRERRSSKRLPPGSLGIPLIGQSISFLRAMRANTAEQWLQQRITKYGLVSKLCLFGKPTVFISGQAANKFIFSSDGSTIASQQVQSIRMILGDRNLLELTGDDHKRVRGALVSFLKPDSLKEYVGKMDEEVKKHLKMHWQGRQQVTVLPLMKTLTFNIITALLFGVEQESQRAKMIECFQAMMDGMWSVPINLPFTRYNRSIKASKRVQSMLKNVIKEKRAEIESRNGSSPHQDLITCLLSVKDRDSKGVSEKEIVHNAMTVMVAGHDTSSVLLTFIMRLLATNPAVYAAVLGRSCQDEVHMESST